MIAFDKMQLLLDVKTDEGFRAYIYDDANDKPIKPGSHVLGHPTVGFGLALDVDPLTEFEAQTLLTSRLGAHCAATLTLMPWVGNLSDGRQRAIFDLAYNLGDRGLAEFSTFLARMRAGNFDDAADDLAGTLWAKEVGSRAVRIVAQIRNG